MPRGGLLGRLTVSAQQKVTRYATTTSCPFTPNNRAFDDLESPKGMPLSADAVVKQRLTYTNGDVYEVSAERSGRL